MRSLVLLLKKGETFQPAPSLPPFLPPSLLIYLTEEEKGRRTAGALDQPVDQPTNQPSAVRGRAGGAAGGLPGAQPQGMDQDQGERAAHPAT